MILTRLLSTALDKTGKWIAKVQRMGKSDIQTGYQATPYGVDSNPIDGMVALFHDTVRKGDNVVVGYLQKNMMAAKGEIRIFSTDSQGNLKSWIWLKNDGTIEINGNANHLTQYEAMKTAFDQLKTDLNSARAALALPPSTADMTGAKTNTVKVS